MSTDPDPYTTREWISSSDSIDLIIPTLREYWGPDLDTGWCRYKYASGVGTTIAILISEREHPVGIAAASLQEFDANGACLIGTISVTTFVNPSHRGRGLYPRLLSELQVLAEAQGASFQVALPNAISQRSFAKAGYMLAGESIEQITITNPRAVDRFLRSIRSVTEFKDLSVSPDPPSADEFSTFLESNVDTPFIQSKLTDEYLAFRLDSRRGRRYSIDRFGDVSAILMHGRRGKLNEVRILSTSPRILSHEESNRLAFYIYGKYAADLVTERSTSFNPPRYSIDGLTITRRARPPLYVLPTAIAPDNFNPRALRLTGIDTHTW